MGKLVGQNTQEQGALIEIIIAVVTNQMLPGDLNKKKNAAMKRLTLPNNYFTDKSHRAVV